MSVLWTCWDESMAPVMCRTKFYARAFLLTPYRAHQRYFQLCELAKRVAHDRLHRQCRGVVAKDPHSSQRFPNASLNNATSLSLNSTIRITNAHSSSIAFLYERSERHFATRYSRAPPSSFRHYSSCGGKVAFKTRRSTRARTPRCLPGSKWRARSF